MALISRNGRAYYYKSAREGGKVVCRYQGAGDNAVLMSRWDAREKDRRDTEAWEAAAERETLEAEEGPLIDYFNFVEDVARARWSRAGVTSTNGNGGDAVSDAKTPETRPKKLSDLDVKGVIDVATRAINGDETTMPIVEQMFDVDPKMSGELMKRYAGCLEDACASFAKTTAGKNLMVREALTRKIASIRDELAGPTPTPLERILCERVAVTWLDVNEMDRRYTDQSGVSFKQAEYQESRCDRAHKRFLAACKTLATVRKLAAPSIQVNLAQQQVNLAGRS